MRASAVESFHLKDIGADGEARLRVFAEADDHITEGVIEAGDGQWFPIVDGVPCFLVEDLRPDFSEFATRHDMPQQCSTTGAAAQQEQALTNETFSDKWRRFKNYGLEPDHQAFMFQWYCDKLGVDGEDALRAFYRAKRNVLEVGPGSGFNSRFIAENCAGDVFALDISDAAHTTFENTRHLPNCHVVQADLMQTPFADDQFDFIIADGVLHHTPDTREAVRALYRKVRPGGQFFFYVYRKMGAARVFVDQHIREAFTKLTPEECYVSCEGITELGRELSRLDATIHLEKPIPALGIPAGTHNVQRLMYYNFIKCFWNEAFDFETNNMVNFDWYHPHNAWQHTDEEVRGWMDELGVSDFSINDANPNGISVLLRKPG